MEDICDISSIGDKCLICGEEIIPIITTTGISSSDDELITIKSKSKSKSNGSGNGNGNGNCNFIETKVNNFENICKCQFCNCLIHIICLAESTLCNTDSGGMCLIPKEAKCVVCGEVNQWSEFLKV